MCLVRRPGIIDVLQEWTFLKRLERFTKQYLLCRKVDGVWLHGAGHTCVGSVEPMLTCGHVSNAVACRSIGSATGPVPAAVRGSCHPCCD